MNTLLVVLLLVASLACPAHALWSRRRGERMCSMLPRGGGLGELERRQRSLARRLENRAFGAGGIDDHR